MAGIRIKLDTKGISEILKSKEFAEVIHEKANDIAVEASALFGRAEKGIVVDDYETDRAASSVTIRDLGAKAAEAKDGVLTKAAGLAGLEVKSKHG